MAEEQKHTEQQLVDYICEIEGQYKKSDDVIAEIQGKSVNVSEWCFKPANKNTRRLHAIKEFYVHYDNRYGTSFINIQSLFAHELKKMGASIQHHPGIGISKNGHEFYNITFHKKGLIKLCNIYLEHCKNVAETLDNTSKTLIEEKQAWPTALTDHILSFLYDNGKPPYSITRKGVRLKNTEGDNAHQANQRPKLS